MWPARSPILALNQAMKGNQKIFLVTQKNSRVEEPGKEDLYTVGVVAKVKQILKAQGEAVRVVRRGQVPRPHVRADPRDPLL